MVIFALLVALYVMVIDAVAHSLPVPGQETGFTT